LHLVGILFPHIIDDARSKPHQTKNSLVVTVHTSARNVFRKGLPTHKPSTFFTASLHKDSACPVNHTLPLGLNVDFLANRRYRHECGGLLLHWLLVGPFTQKTVLHTISFRTWFPRHPQSGGRTSFGKRVWLTESYMAFTICLFNLYLRCKVYSYPVKQTKIIFQQKKTTVAYLQK
jgi:hypothetical protein